MRGARWALAVCALAMLLVACKASPRGDGGGAQCGSWLEAYEPGPGFVGIHILPHPHSWHSDYPLVGISPFHGNEWMTYIDPEHFILHAPSGGAYEITVGFGEACARINVDIVVP